MKITKAVLALSVLAGCAGLVQADSYPPAWINDQNNRLVKAIRAGIPDKNVEDVGPCYGMGMGNGVSMKIAADGISLDCRIYEVENRGNGGVVHMDKWKDTPTQTLSGGVLSAQGFAIIPPAKEGEEFTLADKTLAASEEFKKANLTAETALHLITINAFEVEGAMYVAYRDVLREEKEKKTAEKLEHIRKQLEK